MSDVIQQLRVEVDGLQAASARSYRFERLQPAHGVASPNKPAQGAPEPVNKFCWQPAESQQDNRPEGRNDESDADAVPFLPRFVLQELIFAHCPHQPRSPIRGNFLNKSDWLSLRGIEGLECDVLPVRVIANNLFSPAGVQLSSVRYRNIHFSQHSTHAIFARSVLAQESAATALSCRDCQNRGWTHTRASSTSASIACPGCLVVTERDRKGHDPRSHGRTARPGRFTTYSLAGTIRRRFPVITDSANRAALRDCASCPSKIPTVRIKQHSGVRVSRNKQRFLSFPHAIISSMCRATTLSIKVVCPALFLSRLSVPKHGSGPRQTNRRMGIAFHRYLLKSCKYQRRDPEGGLQCVVSLIKRGAEK